MTTKVYDSRRVRVQVGGFQVTRGPGASGLAIDGPFFKVAQAGPSFTRKRGLDGTACRSKTENRDFRASIFCMKSNALTNGFLSGLILADEIQDNGASIVSLVMVDMGGTDSFVSDEAYLIQRPDMDKAAEDADVEWIFEGTYTEYIVGGN